jgi:hypothetical protein
MDSDVVIVIPGDLVGAGSIAAELARLGKTLGMV